MGCAIAIVRYFVFFTNLVFALAGLAILGVGVAVKLQITDIVDLIDTKFDVAPDVAITNGAIMFVIAFLGCCGAIRESNCMLICYSILLIILLIVKVVFAALILSNTPTVQESVTYWLNHAFANLNTDPNEAAAFYSLQSQYKCCGTTGPDAYGIADLPSSCCDSGAATCTQSNAYSVGCIEVLSDYMVKYANVIAGLVLAVAGVELIGVIFGLCLANHARNMDRRY